MYNTNTNTNELYNNTYEIKSEKRINEMDSNKEIFDKKYREFLYEQWFDIEYIDRLGSKFEINWELSNEKIKQAIDDIYSFLNNEDKMLLLSNTINSLHILDEKYLLEEKDISREINESRTNLIQSSIEKNFWLEVTIKFMDNLSILWWDLSNFFISVYSAISNAKDVEKIYNNNELEEEIKQVNSQNFDKVFQDINENTKIDKRILQNIKENFFTWDIDLNNIDEKQKNELLNLSIELTLNKYIEKYSNVISALDNNTINKHYNDLYASSNPEEKIMILKEIITKLEEIPWILKKDNIELTRRIKKQREEFEKKANQYNKIIADIIKTENEEKIEETNKVIKKVNKWEINISQAIEILLDIPNENIWEWSWPLTSWQSNSKNINSNIGSLNNT